MEVFQLDKNLKNLIPFNYYTDKGFFDTDLKNLKQNWHFVCLKRDLKKNNDYISLDLFDVPITLQNFNGEIKAFINICPHRFSIIRSKPKGNGILRCLYHGWTFDNSGKPYGIPMKKQLFNLNEKDVKKLSLKRIQIESCGSLIFVNLGSKETLKNFLGKYFSEIEEISKSIGNEIKSNLYHWNANWKVCIENTIDEYHVASVHPETFNKVLGREIEYDFQKRNSGVKINCNKKFLEKWRPLEKKFNERLYKIDGYRHIFIYPLFTIATSLGTSFSLQVFNPISESKTKISSRIFSFKYSKSNKQKEIINALDKSVENFNNEVFDEDKDVCEDVQSGLLKASSFNSRGPLGLNEQRISHFHKTYLNKK